MSETSIWICHCDDPQGSGNRRLRTWEAKPWYESDYAVQKAIEYNEAAYGPAEIIKSDKNFRVIRFPRHVGSVVFQRVVLHLPS